MFTLILSILSINWMKYNFFFLTYWVTMLHFNQKPVIWFPPEVKRLTSMWNTTLGWNGSIRQISCVTNGRKHIHYMEQNIEHNWNIDLKFIKKLNCWRHSRSPLGQWWWVSPTPLKPITPPILSWSRE